MGFNPYRKFRAGAADYAMIIGGTVVTVAFVVWAWFA
jgi:hypothetical protein